jgi:predicted Zn-dependent protease
LTGWIRDAQSRDELSIAQPTRRRELERQARAAFQRAVQLGERRPSVLFQLSLMTDSPSEASALMSLLDEQSIAESPLLALRQTELSLQLNDLAEAERFAAAAVERRPGEFMSWLMLAHVRVRQGQFAEADVAADRAKTLAASEEDPIPGLSDVFVLHVTAATFAHDFDSKQQQLDRARQLLEDIVQRHPESEQLFARARLLSALRDPGAAHLFFDLEQTNPTNPDVLEQIVDYFSRHDAPDYNSSEIVIRNLQRLVQLVPTRASYQLRLSNALAQRGTTEDWETSLRLLESTAQQSDPTTVHRARAALLFGRRNMPTNERIDTLAAAVRELEPVMGGAEATAGDFVLAATMFEEQSRLITPDDERSSQSQTEALDSARRYFQQAARMPAVTPQELFEVASFFMLRTGGAGHASTLGRRDRPSRPA